MTSLVPVRTFSEYERELCLPSTFDRHVGPHHTWTHPAGDLDCRIDHVAIPQDLRSACVFSTLVETFDTGHVTIDHTMVGIQLQWDSVVHTRLAAVASKVGYDRSAICPKSLHPAMCQYSAPSWSQDVESHVDQFNMFVQNALSHAHPCARRGPKKPYIDEKIWALRNRKLQSKRNLKIIAFRLRLEFMFKVWKAWKDEPMSPEKIESNSQYQATLACGLVKSIAQFRAIAITLRKKLCRAKAHALQKRLEKMTPEASAGKILQAVHKFHGPTNPKKIKRRPFPLLKKQDGTLCKNNQEIQDRWAEFFCNMEGGQRLSSQQLRNQWIDNLCHFQQDCFDLDVSQIPTLCDLERAFCRVRTGRAVGLDLIPPEACRYNASQFARSTFSQLLKMMLHGHEAIPHKGGRLTAAHKGKGASDECASYRSLLVSSQIGKCLHRTLRGAQSGCYEAYLQNQQLGGRPGIPVYLGIHHLRAFLRLQKSRNRSSCIVFLDLKEAFYRVLRPLALLTLHAA